MSQFALPIFFVLFLWWFSTGAVLYLVRIRPAKSRLMLAGATIVLAASAWGVATGSQLQTRGAAYLAFTCAILMWGWAEITFLSGLLTGVRKRPCPSGCGTWRRAGHAISAILYHELVLLGLAAIVAALTWNASNQVAAATFLILWTMRLSAKLNLFLGVPILNDEFLPERLGYLRSFFARGPVNLLFPIAVTAATVVAAWLAGKGLSSVSAFETAQFFLLATLMGLAILEHWFMVLPLPVNALWIWGTEFGTRPAIDSSKTNSPFPANAQRACIRATGGHLDLAPGEPAGDGGAPAIYRPNDRNDASRDRHILSFEPIRSEAAVLPHPLLATIWRHP